MRVDLHTHTKLCNHAKGEIDDYINEAIKKGIKIFGFSDHAPMNFDKKYRMSLSQILLYENMVLDAKDRYKEKIEILLGYEVDYLPGLIEEKILKADVDYLIGSVHFLSSGKDLWGFDNPEFIGEYKNKDIDKIWQDYFDAIEAMAKSSLFDIVGHLDLIKIFNFKPKKDVRLIAKNALKAIKKSNMVIEVSSAGFRKPTKEPYPSIELLELAFEMDIAITFASDAHAPKQVGYKLEEVEKIAKNVGYTNCTIFRKRDKEMINF